MDRLSAHPFGLGPSIFDFSRARGHWSLLGLLLVLFVNFVWLSGHDEQRIAEVLFLFAAGALLAFQGGPACALRRAGRRICIGLGIFFTTGAISSSLAFSPSHAVYEWGSLLLLTMMALAIAGSLARSPSAIVPVLRVFCAIAAAYAFEIVVIYFSVWALGNQPDVNAFSPGFNNRRHFNHVETVGLPLLMLAYMLTPAASRLRWLWMATASIWWAVLFVDAGRGTMVALAAGCVVLVAVQRHAALSMLRAMILGALAGIAVYLLFFWAAPKAMGLQPFGVLSGMVERSVNDPASARQFLWKRALELIGAHPWLGVGPLHFAHYAAPLRVGSHPHDWILQIGVEWGIPALLALCFTLALAARGLWRARTRLQPTDTAGQNMLSAWVLIGTAALVDGLVSGTIVMPQSQLMLVLYAGCAIGWAWSLKAPADGACAPWHGAVASSVVLAAMLALAYGMAPQFADKLAHNKPTAAEVQANGTVLWPRQWLLGYF